MFQFILPSHVCQHIECLSVHKYALCYIRAKCSYIFGSSCHSVTIVTTLLLCMIVGGKENLLNIHQIWPYGCKKDFFSGIFFLRKGNYRSRKRKTIKTLHRPSCFGNIRFCAGLKPQAVTWFYDYHATHDFSDFTTNMTMAISYIYGVVSKE